MALSVNLFRNIQKILFFVKKVTGGTFQNSRKNTPNKCLARSQFQVF